MNRDPIPGTMTADFVEHPIRQEQVPRGLVLNGFAGSCFSMGELWILLDRELAGVNGERLWHLSISHPHRHPTWDEIKVARYRLLDPELTFGMLLPPAAVYVNVESHDHVFHLWEIHDPREPWSAG